MPRTVLKFLKTEAGGGMLLVFGALAALIVANSPFATAYFNALKTPLILDLGFWTAEATLKDWVKDGLMAVFFYVIGLELKRELTVGELSDPKTVLLPVAAAREARCCPFLSTLCLQAASLRAAGLCQSQLTSRSRLRHLRFSFRASTRACGSSC